MLRYAAFAVAVALVVGTPPALAGPEEEPSEPLQDAGINWQKGYLLHMMGQYEAAAGYFRKSIEAAPTAEGHTFLGWSLHHMDRTEEAIEECKKAIAIDPDYGNPYNDIGAYLIDLGRPEESIPWLDKAIESKRYCCYQFAHFNKGRVQLMLGDLAGAEQSFERALHYNPEHEPSREALELIRSRKGEAL